MAKMGLAVGASDAKGGEYAFLKRRIETRGLNVLTADIGVMGEPPFEPDVSDAEAAESGGADPSDPITRHADLVIHGNASTALPNMVAEVPEDPSNDPRQISYPRCPHSILSFCFHIPLNCAFLV